MSKAFPPPISSLAVALAIKPATKLPNAGGVQDKLEIMRDEAPEVTPEKQAKDKKLLETGATGKPSGSVANRYG